MEKEAQLVIQIKGLEEEDSELEKEMVALLEDAAYQSIEEAKLTEAGNKELEEKINELKENVQSFADIHKNIVLEEASVQKNSDSAKTESEQITAAVASDGEEGKLKKEAIEGVEKKKKDVAIKLSVLETGMTKKLAVLEAELEVKRSHLVGMDSQVAKEMEIIRKNHEETQAELEEVKKDVLEVVYTEEEVVKELEAIELDIKSQKAVLSEKTKLEEKLGKELTIDDKEIKAAEKGLKSKIKDIDAEESRLLIEKQTLQNLTDELLNSEKDRLEIEAS